jgi:AcrR family transcriptional regulator
MKSGPKRSARAPHQLPPGRHKLSRQYVEENQRDRILDAIVDVTSLAGYAAMSVEDIISAAGVSRRTFYDHFRGKEEAFLAALDGSCKRLLDEVQAAAEGGATFAQSVRDCLTAFVQFIVDDPRRADMVIVEVPAAGPVATDRRNALMRTLTAMLRHGAARDQHARRPPELTAETIVGGIYEVAYSRVLQGRSEELLELLPDLAFCMMQPYLGHEQALAESVQLATPVQAASRASA